jgi:hypothetical protein
VLARGVRDCDLSLPFSLLLSPPPLQAGTKTNHVSYYPEMAPSASQQRALMLIQVGYHIVLGLLSNLLLLLLLLFKLATFCCSPTKLIIVA